MTNRLISSMTMIVVAVTLTVSGAAQDQTKIGANGTLLPPGKTEPDIKKDIVENDKSKTKNTRKQKAKKKTTKKLTIKKPKANFKAKSTASSVLTRLPGNQAQIAEAAKGKVKELAKNKPEPKGKKKTKKTKKIKKLKSKTKTGNNKGTTQKLKNGATKAKPNNGPRRPAAYADHTANRKPAKKLTSKSKTAANKLKGSASKPKTGKNAKYAKKTTKRRPAKNLATTKRRTNTPKKSTLANNTKKRKTTKKPTNKLANKSGTKSKGGKGGKLLKGAGLVGGGAAIGGGLAAIANADKQNISKSQKRKLKTKAAVDTAGALVALKKLNVGGAVMNDVIGTDPISLGTQAVGDLLNGTDNAKQSLKNMKHAWNGSLTKQAFTDPKGAANRVGEDLKNVGQGIGRAADKVGQGLDKAGKNIAKGVKKFDKSVKKSTKKVAKGVDKAAKKVGKAAKDVGKFVGGIFKKKKK